MAEAMSLLRAELGDDAIIVGTRTVETGVELVAATDRPEDPVQADPVSGTPPFGDASEASIDRIHDVLLDHGVTEPLLERLVELSFVVGGRTAHASLAAALAGSFGFAPLSPGPEIPSLMLVGAPGAGKSTATAKLAAECVMAGGRVHLITTDTHRAGAAEQLEAFARILGTSFDVVETPDELGRCLADRSRGMPVLVDTAGINPFDPRALGELQSYARTFSGELVLVAPAGGDARDSAEQATAFKALAPSRMILTRLDIAHRLGGVLAAAHAGGLAMAGYSADASIPSRILPFTADALARLLLPEPTALPRQQLQTEGSRR